MAKNFDSDFHALKVGMVIGALMRADIYCYPDVDDDGDYTAILHLRLDMGDPEPVDVSIKVLP